MRHHLGLEDGSRLICGSKFLETTSSKSNLKIITIKFIIYLYSDAYYHPGLFGQIYVYEADSIIQSIL